MITPVVDAFKYLTQVCIILFYHGYILLTYNFQEFLIIFFSRIFLCSLSMTYWNML